MTPRNETRLRNLANALGSTITQRVVTSVAVLLVGFVAATGKSMVRDVAYKEIAASPVVKALDSARKAQDDRIEDVSEAVDTVDSKVERLEEKVDTFIEVMGAAFPQFKKAAKAHKEKEQENESLRNDLGSR